MAGGAHPSHPLPGHQGTTSAKVHLSPRSCGWVSLQLPTVVISAFFPHWRVIGCSSGGGGIMLFAFCASFPHILAPSQLCAFPHISPKISQNFHISPPFQPRIGRIICLSYCVFVSSKNYALLFFSACFCTFTHISRIFFAFFSLAFSCISPKVSAFFSNDHDSPHFFFLGCCAKNGKCDRKHSK